MANPDDETRRPRVALVTGAGSGIGRATALRLARDGHAVAVTGRGLRPGALEETVGAIVAAGGRAEPFVLDVTERDSVRRGVAAVVERLGAPSIVVNNAGHASSRKFLELTDDDWAKSFLTNVAGPVDVTKACLPAMLAAGWGRIVMIGSTASLQGFPYVAHYVASKHALLGLARSLALEVATKGVTVNCVCPGYVDTGMTQATLANIAEKTGRPVEEARRQLEAHSPQRRLIAPEEVAAAVAYLCSDAAAGVNGHALVINGG